MSSTRSQRGTPRQPPDDGVEAAQPSTVLHVPGSLSPPTIEPATVISKQPPLAAQPQPPVGPVAMLVHELLGKTLEHFEIQRFIGGGGMGAVFEAVDTRLNRPVALKVLSREQGADTETSRRFLNEAQSAARLDHKHIARVYYVGEDQGWHFIALEYIEGANIRDLVDQNGPMPAADSVRYVLQLAEAVAHANSRDVVHRDIKPSNVLVTPSGAAKLVDLGLARLHQVEHSGGDLTASGVTLGTFDYISPEQARDPRSADSRSDIYSLGCTWYFMLTGQPPFPDGTVLQKLLQHQGDAPPDPRTIRPDLPDEAARILLQMMAKDPRDRFQNPNELVGALLILANQLGMQPLATSEFVYLPQPSAGGSWLRQQLPWLAPVAILLGLVGVVQFMGQTERTAELGEGRRGVAASSAVEAPAAQRDTSERRVEGGAERSERRTTEDGTAAAGLEPTRPSADGGVGSNREPPSPASRRPESSNQDIGARPPGEPEPRPRASAIVVAERDSTGAALRLEAQAGEIQLTRSSAAASGADLVRPRDAASPNDVAAERTGAPQRDVPPGGVAPAPGKRDPTSVAKGVLAVDDEPQAGHYASLWAACAAAQSGDIIELRYNGRRQERPMALSNIDLTIRAGEGFQPIVAFAPQLTDPVGSPREMIRLAGGQLSLVNVRCELDLPRVGAPSENWTLLAIEAADSLHVQHCVWTVKNEGPNRAAWHPSAALIAVRPPAGAMTDADGGAPDANLEIRWEDSWARGGADFLRIQDAPVELRLNNAWLALGQHLLSFQGAAAAPVRVELEHVTILAQEGLLQTAEADAAAPRMAVQATNCIFIGGDEAAVVTSLGSVSATAAAPVRWKSDRCIYEGFEVFTRVGGNGAAVTKETRWSEWRNFWGGGRDVWGRVDWREPIDERSPVHERTPADYALAAESAAVGAATDLRDIGMALAELPAAEPAQAAPADDAKASPSSPDSTED